MTERRDVPEEDKTDFLLEGLELEGMPHYAKWTVCRICGHRAMSVYPECVPDEQALECSNCGHMTCGPEENGDG